MEERAAQPWQKRLHNTIYEANTPAGKAFDVALLIAIFASILVVMLDSVASLHAAYGRLFFVLEWTFTILFTIEYVLRLFSIQRPLRYVLSPIGIIDLLAIVPSFLSFFFPGIHSLLVFRAFRLLRIFRIFKLGHFLTEAEFLTAAIRGSVRKIAIFMLAVIVLIVILGSVMYLVEGEEAGFTSIPESIYWGVVTVTTVGYGDIAPVTPLGKAIASVMMLIGYGVIAVPTGLITSELATNIHRRGHSSETCGACGREGHDADARHCKWCGAVL